MAAVRLIACLMLVVFAVQLVNGGVQRRDAPAASESDPLQSLRAHLNTLSEHVQRLASEHNATALFEQIGEQISVLRNSVTEVANNVTQHFSGGAGGAH